MARRRVDDAARLERLRTVLTERGRDVPAWMRRTDGEQRLPVTAAIALAIALQAVLPHPVLFAPRWALIAPELALSVVLSVGNPVRLRRETGLLRWTSIVLTALIAAANIASAVLLVRDLVRPHSALTNSAGTLLASGALIYVTNILAFGLLYWEYDRGGSVSRAEARRAYPDFVFPQMTTPGMASPEWEPTVVDYLYLSFTNATAFSPTDTMPYSRWAKLLMTVQSAVALVVVGLVIARAVNVLS